MKYKNKLIEGGSEKVNITFKESKSFKIKTFYCFNSSKVFKSIDIRKYIDCSLAWPACLVLVE
jgi:hypothetical protein